MVANSVLINNTVQVLPNPCALTIKPRLEYSVFLAESILAKLKNAHSAIAITNTRLYSQNTDLTHDTMQFRQAVGIEASLTRVTEAVKIIKERLDSISSIGSLAPLASPLISMLRTVNSDIYKDFPQISQDLIELSGLLGSIVMDSGSLAEAKFDFKQSNLESEQILAEVNLIVESKIRTFYPNLNS